MKFQKLFFWMMLIGVLLPICAMDEQHQPGLEHAPINLTGGVPVPTRIKEFKSISLSELVHPENYNDLHEKAPFSTGDGKGDFQVTQVTPYAKHWLWGSRVQTEYKYFERPRFFNSDYFPFALATECGHVSHRKINNAPNKKSTEITVSSTTKWPTKYGVLAIGGSCTLLGLAAYLNVFKNK